MRAKRLNDTTGTPAASTPKGQSGLIRALLLLGALGIPSAAVCWAQTAPQGPVSPAPAAVWKPSSSAAFSPPRVRTTSAMEDSAVEDSAAGDATDTSSPDSASEAPTAAEATDIDRLLELANKDIGELSEVKVGAPSLDVEVSSVSRQETTVGRTPAAVFVISEEMIQRSGARSLPEALRLAPGVEVMRYHSGQWSVSIRGFNEQFPNKILVQIDGRSIYNPWWGGVWWNNNVVPIDLVDRIEIVRGPGASLWGANAVNGVINIITKDTADTQGLFIESGGGTSDRNFASGHFGGRIGETATYRLYGQWSNTVWDGRTGLDLFRIAQGGGRIDWQLSDSDVLTFSGDYYDNETNFGLGAISNSLDTGASALLSWEHEIDEDRDWALRCYYDYRRTDHSFGQNLDSKFDVDFQYRATVGERHRLITGFEYRNTRTLLNASVYHLRQFDLADDMYDYFVQDEITLIKDRLYFTAGSKFTHNIFTTFEFQPTGRVLYLPDENTSVWASVSRAVRLPVRYELVNGGLSGVMDIHNVDSEKLLAWEFGIRRQEADWLSWDAALFLYDYEDVISTNSRNPGIPGGAFYANDLFGETYGFELTADCKVTDAWRMRAAYSFCKLALHGDARPIAVYYAEQIEGLTPPSQWVVTSSWDLRHNLSFDASWRYVDHLSTGSVPAYNVADLRLAWKPRPNLEFEIVGRNLLDSEHYEFRGDLFSSSNPVPAEVYGGVSWRR